jgi:DNA-binding NarL/FixJ family response regulator
MITPRSRVPTRVLLVDDDVQQLALRAKVMKVSGFSVITAHHPIAAISMLAEAMEQIDIVILDYDMPVMDGCALASEIRSTRPELKIILYSGAVDIPKSKLTSVDAFIPKSGGVGPLIAHVVQLSRIATRAASSSIRTIAGGLPAPRRQSDSRIVVADDNALMLSFIAELLGKHHDVVGTVRDGSALLDEIGKLSPDVAVVDIGMPHLHGIEVAKEIKKLKARPRLVFVTVHEDAELVRSALSMGVLGYVVKSHIVIDLPCAVRTTLQGEQFVSPCLQYVNLGQAA